MIRNFISKLYSLYTPSFFMSGGGSPSGYVIERSLRFNAASSQYLTRTPSVAGNRKTWTLSTWVKRGKLGVTQGIFEGFASSTNITSLSFGAGDTINLQLYTNPTYNTVWQTTKVFRDPSAYYHIVLKFDTTQASMNDMMRLYVNGELQTFNYINYNSAIPQNSDWFVNSTSSQLIGSYVAANFLDGNTAEIKLTGGQALDASSFGELNTLGQWVAKKYTGTYGIDGFYLDFKDGTSTTTLGYDKSGNGNNWTLTNFTRSAGVNDCWMLDVPAGNGSASAVQPSGNYAVLNPLDSSAVLELGNLRAGVPAGGAWYDGCSSIPFPSVGKIQVEMTVNIQTTASMLGITRTEFNGKNHAQLDTYRTVYDNNGAITRSGTGIGDTVGLPTFGVNDVIGLTIDKVLGEVAFYKNGTLVNSTTNAVYSTVDWKFYVGVNVASVNVNFGQRAFAYPVAGAKALCTANLPIPSIKKPSDHFNVQLSTGANIKTDSEALFTNELEWIKDRANANNHQLIDSVRGSSAVLQSNTTAAETTYTAPSGSSVGWVWRASDSSAVSNTNGSITSQVSANVAAGFSIVTYTGTGVNATVGHGLGIAPKIIISKSRNNAGVETGNWFVWHSLAGTDFFLRLNTTGAKTSISGNGGGTYVDPTSSVFTTAFISGSNIGSNNYIAYCFAEIQGYSKFGSYTGNGSADGTNVTLGFKPAFVMIKRTDTTSNWTMLDNQRDGYNVDNDQLYANTTGAEVTTDLMDLLSNGFKSRSSDASINANGGTYIYMAFAETPFQYSNAR